MGKIWKRPAFCIVQERAEDARGIDVRIAKPIDGAVHPDQRHRPHVPDDPVVFDGLVRHA